MTLQVAVTIVVGAASIIVASAALYVARRVGEAADTIEAADERSRENRELLTGEMPGFQGVLPWLQQLDEEVDHGG